ncbi:MAG: hypothetical protein ABR610_14440 [Thermoanaerobaculia bacterium]|nr:hypothetical protein [Acidobacteriota bacterium]
MAAQQKDYARAFDILEAFLKSEPAQQSVCDSIGRLGAGREKGWTAPRNA